MAELVLTFRAVIKVSLRKLPRLKLGMGTGVVNVLM
jgi:hypothetical protein